MMARIVSIRDPKRQLLGHVLVITAGTSDIPVAEEAKVTAEVMGSRVETLYDVGVAGLASAGSDAPATDECRPRPHHKASQPDSPSLPPSLSLLPRQEYPRCRL